MGQQQANRDGLPFSISDFYWNNQLPLGIAIGMGKIPGISGNNKFGQIGTFNIADGRIPVWEEATVYTYPTSGVTPSIASTSADDTLLGIGAQKVLVSGNDVYGNPQSEIVATDGLTPVELTKVYSRIYRCYTEQVGSSGAAVGVIRVGELPFTVGVPNVTTYAQINDGNDQTQMTIFTVPKGYTCLITSITYSVVAGKPIIFHNEARFKSSVFDTTKPFRNTRTVYVENTYTLPLDPYGAFPEHTDLMVTALATQNGSSCETAFRYILVPNDWYERR